MSSPALSTSATFETIKLGARRGLSVVSSPTLSAEPTESDPSLPAVPAPAASPPPKQRKLRKRRRPHHHHHHLHAQLPPKQEASATDLVVPKIIETAVCWL
jgi:hypothetical protein